MDSFKLNNWMSHIADDEPIRHISIPGTHDSCAISGCLSWWQFLWHYVVYTQKWSIRDQLKNGIRYLDIRCRHKNNRFAIHHGICYLNINFENVLEQVADFLCKNSTETVLMRIREEHDPDGNQRQFEDTLSYYIDMNKFESLFWSTTKTKANPNLGECRGKIVIIQNFNSERPFGLGWKSFQVQDYWDIKSTEVKCDKVKEFLQKANSSNKHSVINHLTGNGGGYAPGDIAQVCNVFMYNYLTTNEHQFVGIIPMDLLDHLNSYVYSPQHYKVNHEQLIRLIIKCNDEKYFS